MYVPFRHNNLLNFSSQHMGSFKSNVSWVASSQQVMQLHCYCTQDLHIIKKNIKKKEDENSLSFSFGLANKTAY